MSHLKPKKYPCHPDNLKNVTMLNLQISHVPCISLGLSFKNRFSHIRPKKKVVPMSNLRLNAPLVGWRDYKGAI